MKSDYLNLVFTRSCDGDHVALQRWYNDHIGILWRCESLQRATLYRRDSALGNEADYLCVYAFPDEEGFLAYEHGSAREAALQVILGGWGREGISITQRTQFRRQWTQRRRPGELFQGVHTFWALDLGVASSSAIQEEADRWLVDQVHHLLANEATQAASLMRAAGSSLGTEVLLGLQGQRALPELPAWRADAWGQSPTQATTRWRWSGRVVADWHR